MFTQISALNDNSGLQMRFDFREIVAYDLYRIGMRPDFHRQYSESVPRLRDTMTIARPRSISDVILIPPRSWRMSSSFLNVFVFGSFRSDYRALVKVADILAQFYLTVDYLPIIEPITNKQYAILSSSQRPIIRDFHERGLLAYHAENRS